MTDTDTSSDWLRAIYAAIDAANNENGAELRRIITETARADYDLREWGDLTPLDRIRIDQAIDATVGVAASVIFGLIGWNRAESVRLVDAATAAALNGE